MPEQGLEDCLVAEIQLSGFHIKLLNYAAVSCLEFS